jgi:hypothetical protein
MSGYIIEEPEEFPIFYNTESKTEISAYWKLYSKVQEKRFKKVLFQLKDIWNDVYNQIKFMRNYASFDISDSNNIMFKIHKIFIIQLKTKIEYYNEEKLMKRKQKNYLSKKINKLKSTKQKI